MIKKRFYSWSFFLPLVVVASLASGLFLGSRHPIFKDHCSTSDDYRDEIEYCGEPQVVVWLSKHKYFIWNKETPQPLENLPARVKKFKDAHVLNAAAVSAEELVVYEDMVNTTSELRRAGFRTVTLVSKPQSGPGDFKDW